MNKQLLFFIWLVTFSTVTFSQTLNELKATLEKTTNPNELPKIHRDIGTFHYNNGDFTNALKHFFKFLEAAEKVDNKYNIAVSYQAIGSVYMETEKFDEAVKYLEKAERILFDLNEIESLGRTKITLGNVYYLQYQDSISEVYYKEALHHFQAINDSVGLRDAYKNLGSLYFEMGNQRDTIIGAEFMKNSLKYVKDNDTLSLFQTLVGLGEIYAYSGNLSEAKIYLDRCAEYTPYIKAIHKKADYYYALHHYHKEIGDFEQALANFKLFKIYKDSILNTENNNLLNELNIKYETEQKEQHIELLTAQEQKQQLTILVIMLSVVLLSIVSLLLFVRFKKQQKRKSAQELQAQKEAERIRISSDMHDEIGAGLTRIVMQSEQIKMQLQSGKELKNGIVESLDKMASESRELSRNIGEIIWALNPKNDTLDNLFAYIRNYVYDYLDEVNITCKIAFPENIPATSVSPELRRNVFLIVKEALNNLVKHANATQANVILLISENHFSLTIKDNGTGIADRTQTSGNGLGNMKKRTETIGGIFSVENNINNGTAIKVERVRVKSDKLKVKS